MLAYDSAPVSQAKRLEIWQDKFSILCREASTQCASETQNLSRYECLESESGTVFNTYPPSPIPKFLIHIIFLMLFPLLNCYFLFYRSIIENLDAAEFLTGLDPWWEQMSELTQTVVIFASTPTQGSLQNSKNCKYLDIKPPIVEVSIISSFFEH